jgi:hypothetical protein
MDEKGKKQNEAETSVKEGPAKSSTLDKFKDQTAKSASKMIGKAAIALYWAGAFSSKKLGEIYVISAKYITKYKDHTQISQLSEQKDEQLQKLGPLFYKLFKENKHDAAASSKDPQFLKIIEKLETLEKKIILLGRKLDSKTPE